MARTTLAPARTTKVTEMPDSTHERYTAHDLECEEAEFAMYNETGIDEQGCLGHYA